MNTFAYMAQEKYRPTPVRLKEYKAPLQEEAFRLERSLNWLILKILKEHPIVIAYMNEKQKRDKNLPRSQKKGPK